MEDWTRYLQNPRAIESLYSECPSLRDFDLFGVSLDREGPIVRVRGNLSTFPSRPSPRWPAAANRVQLTLALSGISELSVTGWSTENVGDLSFAEAEPGGTRVVFASRDCRIECVARWIDVESVSAYVSNDD